MSNLVHLRRDTLRVARRQRLALEISAAQLACVRAGGLSMMKVSFQREVHPGVPQIEVGQRTTGQGVNVHKNTVLKRRSGIPPATQGQPT